MRQEDVTGLRVREPRPVETRRLVRFHEPDLEIRIGVVQMTQGRIQVLAALGRRLAVRHNDVEVAQRPLGRSGTHARWQG
jgi:hypothetical protein